MTPPGQVGRWEVLPLSAVLEPPGLLLEGVHRRCRRSRKVATCGYSQRWGSSSTGRARTQPFPGAVNQGLPSVPPGRAPRRQKAELTLEKSCSLILGESRDEG